MSYREVMQTGDVGVIVSGMDRLLGVRARVLSSSLRTGLLFCELLEDAPGAKEWPKGARLTLAHYDVREIRLGEPRCPQEVPE